MKTIQIILAAGFLFGGDLVFALASPCFTEVYNHLLNIQEADPLAAETAALKTCRYFGGPHRRSEGCKLVFEACIQTVVRRFGVKRAAEHLRHYEASCADMVMLDWQHANPYNETDEECEAALDRELTRSG